MTKREILIGFADRLRAERAETIQTREGNEALIAEIHERSLWLLAIVLWKKRYTVEDIFLESINVYRGEEALARWFVGREWRDDQ